MSVLTAEKTVQDVGVNLMTMTATYVTNTVFNGLYRLVSERGLTADYLNEQHRIIESGLLEWVSQRALKTLFLEVLPATGTDALERFGFNFEYYADPDTTVRELPIAEVAQFCQTLEPLPADASYRVVAILARGATPMEGWSQTELRPIQGNHVQISTSWGFGMAGITLSYLGNVGNGERTKP